MANYDRSFGKHNIGITVGIEAEKRDQNFLKAFRKYFLSPSKDDMDLGGVTDMTNNGDSWKEARLNYFGRVSYNYMERYLVEFVWRADGSYRFPKEKRYGFFPGVSAAWRVSEEGWWKDNVRFIDYFKLRGSISQTGNDALVDTDGNLDRSVQYLNTYGFNGYYLFGSTYAPFLSPTPYTEPQHYLGSWNNL